MAANQKELWTIASNNPSGQVITYFADEKACKRNYRYLPNG